jgi:ankyrin repeat protein
MTRFTRLGTVALVFTVLLSGCATDGTEATTSATPAGAPSATPASVVDDSPLEDQLLAAITSYDARLVEALAEAGADLEHDYGNRLRPLHLAVNAGDADVVSALLAHGVDVEAPLIGGETPLLLASRFNNPDVARVLVEAGADLTVFTSDPFNESPLLRATRLDNVDVVTALLEAGADVEIKGETYGATPLASAAYWGSVRSAEALILFGADVTFVDENGITLIGIARDNGHVELAALLEAVGAPE